jgi:hypothetical protein
VSRGFGFVHHSRTIICRAVPNPYITIRNLFIAAHRPGALVCELHAARAAGAAPRGNDLARRLERHAEQPLRRVRHLQARRRRAA